MPVIASLEHFNFMPDFTPDGSADTSPITPESTSEQEPEKNGSEMETPGSETPLKPEEIAPEPSSAAGTSSSKLEDALPPEAQGEANGGPLGCCLGVMVGLLLSLSLAILSRVYATTLAGALQGNYGLLGLFVRILMGIFAFALAIFFGYAGWRLGKRFYREYDPPVLKSRSKARKSQQKA